MRIALLTQFSPQHLELRRLTSPSKNDHCRKWGHTHVEICDMAIARTCWARPRIWRKLLGVDKWDWIWVLGTDAIVTNPAINALQFCGEDHDLAICVDMNGINCDSFFLRNCDRSAAFVEAVLAREGLDANEQDAMNVVLSRQASQKAFRDELGSNPANARMQEHLNRTALRVRLFEPRDFNAYPWREYGGTGAEPWCWQPGMFVLHFPGEPLEVRLRFFSRFLSK